MARQTELLRRHDALEICPCRKRGSRILQSNEPGTEISHCEYYSDMSIKEIEAAALKLVPKERARLAEKLLESLVVLSLVRFMTRPPAAIKKNPTEAGQSHRSPSREARGAT